MFKSMKNWIAAVVVTSAVCTTGVQADGEDTYEEGFTLPFDLSVGVDFASAYVWRSIEVNDEAVVQPWVDISKSFDGVISEGDSLTIGFNWWGNYDLSDGGRDDNFSEYDWTGYLSYSTGKVTVDAGVIYYYFPGLGGGDGADTIEAFIGVSFDVLLQPSFTAYYDFDDAEGWFLTASLGHSFELTENLSLDLGADISWADSDQMDFYFDNAPGNPSSGFTAVHGVAALSYTVNENFSIGAAYNYSHLIDEAKDYSNWLAKDNNSWGVLSAEYSF